MWAQVGMNEFYEQFEKKKKTYCITVGFYFLRAFFHDTLIITVLKFIAEQLSYSFLSRVS